MISYSKYLVFRFYPDFFWCIKSHVLRGPDKTSAIEFISNYDLNYFQSAWLYLNPLIRYDEQQSHPTPGGDGGGEGHLIDGAFSIKRRILSKNQFKTLFLFQFFGSQSAG